MSKKAKPQIQAASERYRAKFARMLAALRKKCGFETAYGFYHKSCPSDGFEFSYNHYLMIERGKRLPSQEALDAILAALGNSVAFAQDLEDLVTCYVRALLDGDSLFDLMFKRVAAADSEAREEASVATASLDTVPRLSEKQVELVHSSGPHYWIHNLLLETGGRFQAQDLAGLFDFPKAQAAKALEDLERLGLVEKTASGNYFSPHFRAGLVTPEEAFTKERSNWVLDQQLRGNRSIMGSGEPGDHTMFHGNLTLALEDESSIEGIRDLGCTFLRDAYNYRPGEPMKSGMLFGLSFRISCLAKLGG